MNLNQLSRQFAQALANGELTISDIGYVLEHVDGFLLDNAPGVALWIPRTFEEIAADLYKAESMAEVTE